MKILILLALVCLLLPSTKDETSTKSSTYKSNNYNQHIDHLTKSELDYYVKNNGLTEYKDYSIDTLKQKLKDRHRYFN